MKVKERKIVLKNRGLRGTGGEKQKAQEQSKSGSEAQEGRKENGKETSGKSHLYLSHT